MKTVAFARVAKGMKSLHGWETKSDDHEILFNPDILSKGLFIDPQ